jgi:hypothetical protein
MKRLIRYKTSQVNQINIRYGKEVIKFNLFAEVRIIESQLEKELKYQPSYYGFLLLLHKQLMAEFEKLKHERKRVHGLLYLNAKDRKATNGRFHSDEGAKAYADSHKRFLRISTQCIKVREDADKIYACVRAFEQRKDLMQTLSSNIRKERGS